MRHVPSSESHLWRIASFEETLAAYAARKGLSYDKDKWLYLPHEDREYRYVLGTRGKRPLVCTGINPSTAIPDRLDNTLKSVERIAFANGFDSFLMFNVYAQRATSPDDMDRDLNSYLHEQNMQAFRYLLELSQVNGRAAVWAAWGAIVEKRAYLYHCIHDMVSIAENYNTLWFSAGPKSKAGHPHHPLYLKKDSVLEAFDVARYLDKYLGSSAAFVSLTS